MKPPEKQKPHDPFASEISRKASRRLGARRRDKTGGVWFSLGTFGMVGWSIAVPTLLGVIVGTWLEPRVPVAFSWRLTLLMAGLVLGCLNAWYWVSKERGLIGQDTDDQDE